MWILVLVLILIIGIMGSSNIHGNVGWMEGGIGNGTQEIIFGQQCDQ